ncbi:hypothetical protein Ahy_B10g105861 isoform F [Arachis hypogaea]|uniref:Uncharacterized protein n=1 Tax=Arachis hypogaea TaxID=3818 RepID=A0A444X921_ARAHY|nr:hypothetical protein Ahy_B10g105861 isoform F [Arachis hypogaea]
MGLGIAEDFESDRDLYSLCVLIIGISCSKMMMMMMKHVRSLLIPVTPGRSYIASSIIEDDPQNKHRHAADYYSFIRG